MKIRISAKKNMLHGINILLETAKEKISELEDVAIDILIESKTKTEQEWTDSWWTGTASGDIIFM